jgi:hypothetical protein
MAEVSSRQAHLDSLLRAVAAAPPVLVRAGDSDNDAAEAGYGTDGATSVLSDDERGELASSKAFKRLNRRCKKYVKRLGMITREHLESLHAAWKQVRYVDCADAELEYYLLLIASFPGPTVTGRLSR